MSQGAQPSNYNLRSAGPVGTDSDSEIEEELNMAAPHSHSHIHLEPFKGQGEDPERWLSYFERYCQYHNLNADRAALSMPFHLKGVAKIWFDSLQDTTKGSFRLLREAFIARFKPQNNIDITVLSMCQKQDESVEEYYSRFIDNMATKDLPENIQITVITKGLLPQLVSLVMPQNPQTLEELRQAMVLAEQTHRASQPKQSVASTSSSDANLTEEIRCLRNQLSEVLAIQNQQQQQQQQPRYQPNFQQPRQVPDYQGRRSAHIIDFRDSRLSASLIDMWMGTKAMIPIINQTK